MDVSPPTDFEVLRALDQLLDTLEPSELDPTRSYAIDGEFYLAHRVDVFGDIEVSVSPGATYVNTELKGPPEEIYEVAPTADGSGWLSDLVDSVAEIVTGTYLIETFDWGNRRFRTVVHGPDHRYVSGPIFGLLPVPRRLLTVARRELTYGCRGTLDRPTASV